MEPKVSRTSSASAAMLEARDWILRNVLFLDPSLPPFAHESEQATNTAGEKGDENAGNPPSEIRSSWLTLLPCTLDVGGISARYKVKCTKMPDNCIVICNRDGEEMKGLQVKKIASVTRVSRTKVKLIMKSQDGEKTKVFQIELDFTPEVGNCNVFCEAIKGLYNVDVGFVDPVKRRKPIAGDEKNQALVSSFKNLVIEGSGVVDEALKLQFLSPLVQRVYHDEAVRGKNKGLPFPFQSIQWFVAEEMGGVNVQYHRVPCLEHTPTMNVTTLATGHFFLAKVKVDPRVVEGATSTGGQPFVAVKGPIIPAPSIVLELLSIITFGSRSYSVSAKVSDLITLTNCVFDSETKQNYKRRLEQISKGRSRVPCTISTTNEVTKCLRQFRVSLTPQKLILKTQESSATSESVAGSSKTSHSAGALRFVWQWDECLLKLPECVTPDGSYRDIPTREEAFHLTLNYRRYAREKSTFDDLPLLIQKRG